MNEYDVKRLAAVLALQAEIEGMKIHNKIKTSEGNYITIYGQSDFDQMAFQLRELSSKHNEQL